MKVRRKGWIFRVLYTGDLRVIMCGDVEIVLHIFFVSVSWEP